MTQFRKALAAIMLFTISIFALDITPVAADLSVSQDTTVYAKGSSGGRSSSRPSSGGSSSSGSRSSTKPKPSGTTSSGGSTSGGSRESTRPRATGSTTYPGGSTVKPTSQAIPKVTASTRVGTSSGARTTRYTVGDHTYRYTPGTYRSYYRRYDGGYPPVGSAMYWTLWNDPFYYPNYTTPGNPWFGHSLPIGYTHHNGMLVADKDYDNDDDGFDWGKLLLWLVIIGLVVAALIGAVWWWYNREDDSTFADKF